MAKCGMCLEKEVRDVQEICWDCAIRLARESDEWQDFIRTEAGP